MENKGEPLALLLDVENILFLTTLKHSNNYIDYLVLYVDDLSY